MASQIDVGDSSGCDLCVAVSPFAWLIFCSGSTLAEFYGVAFRYIEVKPGAKQQAEEEQLRLIAAERIASTYITHSCRPLSAPGLIMRRSSVE